MSIIRQSPSRSAIPRPFALAVGAAALLVLALAAPALGSDRIAHLVDVHVSPRVGSPTTTIAFGVTYRDAHGDAPDAVKVIVDGVAHQMTPGGGSDYVTGVPYGWATTLPLGVHLVAFAARAGTSDLAFAAAGIVKIKSAGSGDGAGGGAPGGGSPGGGTPGGGGSTPVNGGQADGGGGSGSTGPGPSVTPTAPAGDTAASPPPSKAPAASHGAAGGSATSPTHGSTPKPAAADHSKTKTAPGAGDGTQKGVPPRDLSTATPDAPIPSADGPDDQIAIALGDGGSTRAGGEGGSGDAGSGAYRALGGGSSGDVQPANATLAVLGAGGVTATERMVLAAISTTTTTTTIMAFILFGKRRRDGEPPAPDEVLAANAARLMTIPSSALVPACATNPVLALPGEEESDLPRWRRPSLLAARRADPLRSTAASTTLTFEHGSAAPAVAGERHRVRYRIVSLLDAPDELRSSEIGFLDEGDEVELLDRSGSYYFVACPDGSRGWLHRMTLGELIVDKAVGWARVEEVSAPVEPLYDEGDGDDLLGDYLRLRHRS